MDAEMIRMRLGLKPWDEFAAERIAYNAEAFPRLMGPDWVRQRDRGIGKTLKMLCEVLAVVAKGKSVFITGSNSARTKDLRLEARQMAEHLGLDPMLICSQPRAAANQFRDHAW